MLENQQADKTNAVKKEMLKQSFQTLIDKYIPVEKGREFSITYTTDWGSIQPTRLQNSKHILTWEESYAYINIMKARTGLPVIEPNIWSTILLLDENGTTLGIVGDKIQPPKPKRWFRPSPEPYKIFDARETAAEAISRIGVEKQVKYLLDVDTKTLYL